VIEPAEDFAGEVEEANQYNVELEDDGPKIIGKHKTDTPAWATLAVSEQEQKDAFIRQVFGKMKRESGKL
jgi:hypothetical protein